MELSSLLPPSAPHHGYNASVSFLLHPPFLRFVRIAERGRKRRRRRLQSRFSRSRGDSARQLLFLHSSKSSLESNLPVCYCIQTTPTANLLALSLSSRCPHGSFTIGGGSVVYVHSRVRIHVRTYVYAFSFSIAHDETRVNEASRTSLRFITFGLAP